MIPWPRHIQILGGGHGPLCSATHGVVNGLWKSRCMVRELAVINVLTVSRFEKISHLKMDFHLTT